jgi:hypothetical protein
MSTSLRAGYSLLQATEAVSSEAQNPTAREFGRAISEARLGITVTDSLNGIVERTQSQDFEWAVMAIEIQREVGGNLAEVLTDCGRHHAGTQPPQGRDQGSPPRAASRHSSSARCRSPWPCSSGPPTGSISSPVGKHLWSDRHRSRAAAHGRWRLLAEEDRGYRDMSGFDPVVLAVGAVFALVLFIVVWAGWG